MVDPVISMGAGLVLAFVFAAAALHKFRDPAYFSATLAAYDLLPALLVPVAGRLLPVLELAVAGTLLPPQTRGVAGVAATALLGVYTLGIGINLARGRRAIDCGCGDPAQRQGLSAWLLVRNGALLGLALFCAAPAPDRATGWLDWTVAMLAAVSACLVYSTGNQLLANRELLANLGSSRGHA